ncbi:metal ABC transporter permease [Rappaport israeli]|uniref:metal ABC transporter permease n=1 Tax=Rappaport israeli TaxID=1839807 RepID=UPI0009304EA6|nr:metal ABC transporter permease [Rappaport israeli]
MMALLVEPFLYDYMIKALVVAAFVGSVCALLSVFLMLKGWSLIGDALSHSVVPGVAVAYILGWPYAVGAFITGILATMAILLLRQLCFLRQDAIIGLVFTSFFALGLLIISLFPTSISLQAVIYGNILAIAERDFQQMLGILLLALLVIIFKWRDLMLLFFDQIQAVASGVSVRWLQVLFFMLVSAAVVAALQVVGAILVVALLITPGATAFLLAKRFGVVLFIALSIGLFSSVLGVYLSYFMDAVTGTVIVLLQALVFMLAFVFAPEKGLLVRMRKATLAKRLL